MTLDPHAILHRILVILLIIWLASSIMDGCNAHHPTPGFLLDPDGKPLIREGVKQ